MNFFLENDPRPFIVATLMAFYLPLMGAVRTGNPAIVLIALMIQTGIIWFLKAMIDDNR
jgi:hypothetical protein